MNSKFIRSKYKVHQNQIAIWWTLMNGIYANKVETYTYIHNYDKSREQTRN